nr:DUF6624 domain-containing protein [Pedobacter sp. ASV19]
MKIYTLMFGIVSMWFLSLQSIYAQGNYDYNIHQAELFNSKKQYLDAARSYSRAFATNHNLGRVDHRYEAARCYALAGINDSAFVQLEKIFKAGYDRYNDLISESSFKSLRNDGRWPSIVKLAKQEHERAITIVGSNIRNNNLIKSLDSIFTDDQSIRIKLQEIESKSGVASSEWSKTAICMARHDSINTIKIAAFLDKYGWLGKDEIGEKGNNTLFLVIQHSNLATQLKYLPLLRQAVKEGKVKASSLALLEDRVALREGKKQIFGSQLKLNNLTGKYFVQPLLDPENVNKRRAQVGLEPIEEYVKRWGIEWNLEQYKKEETKNGD